MDRPIRENLKKIFKKVKKLRLPPDFDEVIFDDLFYYSWLDQSDMALFVLYNYKGQLVGIKFDVILPPVGVLRLGFCEFCHKHRKKSNIFFISAETKKKPKGVNYRSRGTWICSQYKKCNQDMKDDGLIADFFQRMLE